MWIQKPNGERDERPTMTWVVVTDASGRTHLEARWSVTPKAPATSHAA
jgi:hypothetical protein